MNNKNLPVHVISAYCRLRGIQKELGYSENYYDVFYAFLSNLLIENNLHINEWKILFNS